MSSKASSTKAPTTPDHWDHIRARSIVIIITSNFILKTSIVLIIIITYYAVLGSTYKGDDYIKLTNSCPPLHS